MQITKIKLTSIILLACLLISIPALAKESTTHESTTHEPTTQEPTTQDNNKATNKKAANKIDTKIMLEIEKIQQYYLTSKDFTVDFTQNYHSKITKRIKTSSGIVDFAQPMLMRWEYSQPQKKSFITNGKSLWIVEWEEKEIKYHKDLGSSAFESSLAFMWGGEALSNRYVITKLQIPEVEGIIKRGKRLLFELLPKEKEQYEVLYLLIDPKTYRIEEVVLVDLIGNLNNIIFKSPKTGQKFKKGHFTFKAPSPDWTTLKMDFN